MGPTIGIYNNADLMKRGTETNEAGEDIQSTEATLAQRGNRYGDFAANAYVSQEFKASFYQYVKDAGKQEEDIPDVIWEATDMIFQKLARVINGDPYYDDNWRDIAGYAELVVKELNKDK